MLWNRQRKHSSIAIKCESERKTRVLVVGGGVIGSSIAFHLAARAGLGGDLQVTLISEDSPDAASKKSWGYANSSWKTPLDYHTLNQLAVNAWPSYLRTLGCPEAGQFGALWWATDTAAAEVLRDRLARAWACGHGARLVSRAKFLELAGPNVCAADFVLGAYTEEEAVIDAHSVASAALAALERHGGAHVQARAKSLVLRDGLVAGVTLQSGEELSGDIVVVAAGCGSGQLLASAGEELRAETVRDAPSYAFGVQTQALPDMPMLIRFSGGPDGKVEAQQFVSRPDGRVLLDSPSSSTTAGERQAAWSRYVPGAAEWRVSSEQTAKPVPLDGKPIQGFVGRQRRLYVSVTHSGVTLAPLLGHLAALEIVEGIDAELLGPFRPSRFDQAVGGRGTAYNSAERC